MKFMKWILKILVNIFLDYWYFLTIFLGSRLRFQVNKSYDLAVELELFTFPCAHWGICIGRVKIEPHDIGLPSVF